MLGCALYCIYIRIVCVCYMCVCKFAFATICTNYLLVQCWTQVAYSRCHDLLSVVGFMVTLACIRRLRTGGHLWAGAPCSSFVWMSRGSTKRCRLRVRGARALSSVKKANRFLRRLCMGSLGCMESYCYQFLLRAHRRIPIFVKST